MRSCISVGKGGSLLLFGSEYGPRVVSDNLTNAPIVGDDVSNEYAATLDPGSISDYWQSCWGGPLTMLPMNVPHKPGAFYYGKFYFYKHRAQINDKFFLLRFDGSGNYFQQGSASFNNKSLSGRGTEFISPSGTTEFFVGPMCTLTHNDSLFYVGSAHTLKFNTTTSNWITKLGWDTGPDKDFGNSGNDALTGLARRKIYCSFYVHKQNKDGPEHKGFGAASALYNRAIPSGLASSYEDLNACDAISWKNDIIYANNVDIVHFPGGSGTPRYIETTTSPSFKSFEIFPSGGFENDSTIGDPQLFTLYSSGVLRKINFAGDPEHDPNGRPFADDLFTNPQGVASGYPFGTTSIINLGNFVADFFGPKVRTLGPRARAVSSTAEPDRSCLLKSFDNKLHAFFVSAASGYYHFVCDGDPRETTNWTDRTTSLPTNLKIKDGCIYGYRDDAFGTLNILHVAYSNIGAFGSNGGNTGAGGWTLYTLYNDLSWKTIQAGVSNGPPCGLIPYNPEIVYSQIPSGIKPGVAPGNPTFLASTDYVDIEYQLFSPRKPHRLANVFVEYTVNDGVTWNSARRFRDYATGEPLGSGTTNLIATPEGRTYNFLWHHVYDLGFNSEAETKVRIRTEVAR